MSESNSIFKQNVIQYCTLDEQIKDFNKQIKDIKEKQKTNSEHIMTYMSNNSLEVCNAGTYGVLTLKKSNSKSGVNKDTVKDSLLKILEDKTLMSQPMNVIADNGTDLIMNNRDITEKNVLKRSVVKKEAIA
jgi:hypothetical protein